MVGIFYQQLYIWHNCSIMRCTYTNPKPKLKLNVTFDPQRCQKHHASHYGAHLTTYDQVAQYSTCTCGSDPLLLALVVFFHSLLAYLLYCHMWWYIYIYTHNPCAPSPQLLNINRLRSSHFTREPSISYCILLSISYIHMHTSVSSTTYKSCVLCALYTIAYCCPLTMHFSFLHYIVCILCSVCYS